MNNKLIRKVLGTVLFVTICAPVIFFLLVYNHFFVQIPSYDDIAAIQNIEASVVYDSQGDVIGKYYTQDRTVVSLDAINPFLIGALIATEDKRFYEHKGVDVRSLGRVLIKSLLLQKSAGGGSTITLQLAKNLYPRKSFTFFYYPIHKTREAIIAYRIEQSYSKAEILELYLNTVSFGEDVYGIESASARFFNTTARDIPKEQAATLVGMLKATTSYNPNLHPERSLERRNVVLKQMLLQDKITSEEYEKLSQTPLGVNYQPSGAVIAPYFLAQVKQKVNAFIEDYNAKNDAKINLNTDGLKIYTTIDRGMQMYAEKAMKNHMKGLQNTFDKHWEELSLWSQHTTLLDNQIKQVANGRSPREIQQPRSMYVYTSDGPTTKTMSPIDSLKHYLQQLQAGFFALEPQTGAVKAWVGGIDFQFFPYDHVQITAKRQVGSTFKPIVYAAALEKGISPCNYYEAAQETYTVKEGEWVPKNDDASYEGKYTMEGALENSVNTVSVKILNDVGIQNTIKFANSLGISSTIPDVPSIALGTPSISLTEMVTAYAAFVNSGRLVNPYTIERIEDSTGKVLYEHKNLVDEQVVSGKTSSIMIHLLQNVVDEGTAKSLRNTYALHNDIGGKTGTTQNNADGWFIAVTPNLVSGAWVGGIYPEISFQSTRLGQGATMALPVFAKFYSALTKNGTYDAVTQAKFAPLPQKWQKELACDPFKEDFDLFDWLFKRNKEKEDQDKAENAVEDNEGFLKKIGDIFKKKDKKNR